MREVIFKIINKFTEGVDTYHNNGSMWLIFTDEKKWVIELTKEGTLWYNYYFFGDCFKYVSLDVVENQHYITEWVESIIQNGIKSTEDSFKERTFFVEDTIQNGVKNTEPGIKSTLFTVEYTIQNGIKKTQYVTDNLDVKNALQNGIKETKHNVWDGGLAMEEVIQNGVKETYHGIRHQVSEVEDTIQNGVKRTELGGKDRKIDKIKDIVENGIKETTPGGYLGSVEMRGKTIHQFETAKQLYHVEDVINDVIKETESIASHRTWKSEQVIQNGIKETKHCSVSNDENARKALENGIKETNPHFLEIMNPINFEPTITEMKRMNEVNIVLEKGIKEVKELPDKSGELRGYGDYYNRQEDRTKPHTQYVDDVVLNGIKETKYCELHSLMRADHIIRDGIKETKSVHIHNGESIESVIKNGINETKRLKDENRPQIRNIIENGIKQTNWRKVEHFPDYTDRITKKG